MLKALAATCVALFLSTTAMAQPANPYGIRVNDPAAGEAVKAAELARFKAMTSGDLKTLETSLGDDLVYTHSNALVDSKASYVESIRSGKLKYVSIEPRDLQVRVYGTAAVITGAAAITSISNGQTMSSTLRYTDVWVLRDGRWQMIGWQSTRVPQ